MSRTIIESGTPLPTDVFYKSWLLRDVFVQTNAPTIGVALSADHAALDSAGFLIPTAYNGYADAYVNLRMVDGRLRGNVGQYRSSHITDAYLTSSQDAAMLSADRAAIVSPDVVGRPWSGVRASAKEGQWVRRKGWSDTTQKIRFAAGNGSALAVAVIRSSTIDDRAVRNSEFGLPEWNANDWIFVDAPNELVGEDLTDAQLVVAMLGNPYGVGSIYWMLYSEDGSPVTGPGPGTGPGTGPGVPGVTLPVSGRGFVYLRDGTPILVSSKDIYGVEWEP